MIFMLILILLYCAFVNFGDCCFFLLFRFGDGLDLMLEFVGLGFGGLWELLGFVITF